MHAPAGTDGRTLACEPRRRDPEIGSVGPQWTSGLEPESMHEVTHMSTIAVRHPLLALTPMAA